jgi:hypothetical protein
LPDTETNPTNDLPQQERTPIPEEYFLPDRHQEVREKQCKLVEYSNNRKYITLDEIYSAAINVQGTKYIEECEI